MNKLNILWTNDNPETAHTMVFMYAVNAKVRGWWEEVDVIIWGATAKLVAENEGIRERITLAINSGVKLRACVSCAEIFGVVDVLKDLGVEVLPMGIPLTDILKSDEKLLTI